MSEKEAQINVKLERDTLEKWDKYLKEESDFTTRSEFVRFAVNREVDQQHEPNQAITGENQALLQKIRDSVVGLSDRMDSVENQVDTLQSAVRSDPQVEELANEIFSVLPNEEPGTPDWREKRENLQTQAQAESDEELQTEAHAWEGTPEGLAQALNTPERKVHQALNKLISETHLIRSEETGDGETRYWKEV